MCASVQQNIALTEVSLVRGEVNPTVVPNELPVEVGKPQEAL